MRSVEMKNRCLLYYGNPVGYRTEQGVVADSMFRREELEDWLARKGLAVRWEDGIYDRLSSGGYQKAADNGPALKSCRIWQLGPSAPAAMRFIGLDRMSGEYGGPDLTRYEVPEKAQRFVAYADKQELEESIIRRHYGTIVMDSEQPQGGGTSAGGMAQGIQAAPDSRKTVFRP